MAAKYDKSQVMKRAWYIYRHSYCTFSEALKESWKRFKEEVSMQEKAAKRSNEFQSKMKARNYRLNRTYHGCWFGHNDWRRDYQDDAKVAIDRAHDLRRLNN